MTGNDSVVIPKYLFNPFRGSQLRYVVLVMAHISIFPEAIGNYAWLKQKCHLMQLLDAQTSSIIQIRRFVHDRSQKLSFISCCHTCRYNAILNATCR